MYSPLNLINFETKKCFKNFFLVNFRFFNVLKWVMLARLLNCFFLIFLDKEIKSVNVFL